MVRGSRFQRLVPAAGLLLLAGCNTGTSGLPSTPPLAAKEPSEILAHLKYLAGSKDVKQLIVIAPIAPDIVFPSAWWFHKQSRDLGIDLTPEEMKTLGVEKWKDKLDNLPRAGDELPGYGIDDARAAFNAGVYRLVKGFSPEEWGKMYVMDVRQNAYNVKVTDVTIGFDGQPKIIVSCIKRTEDTWGVANLQYKVGIAKKK
ncbi:MAG TPA: hypothetical protein VJ600_01440 [Holophagaceae bacterium]|nr:hypothetical protein [Holophagaceae bacterium]